ncbi:MAG: tRNA 2-thiouridine(34) synthase MnmA [Spirochaetes bacterium]|nr:tRNA 2-thiouridine(34) synthase MnmA [Spirochaetota bacterium]
MADTLFVAMSGGIDSTVTSILLRDSWEKMAGATHYIWPDSRCCSLDVRSRAESVCRSLGIPYYVVDLEKEFRKEVVDNFITTYLEGRTPNPCIMCNRKIRFDYFYSGMETLLRREGLLGSGDTLHMATGHYVRLERKKGTLFLKKGKDPVKDQSYMLYRIPAPLLDKLIFPLGGYLKSEVYRIAAEHGVHDETLKESQDACFVEDDYGEFIERATGKSGLFKQGPIKDTKGNILGKHRGYIYYTIGQRKGLGLGSGPWYVSGIDAETNTVYVGRREEAESRVFTAGGLNWFGKQAASKIYCTVKVRYQSSEINCTVMPETEDIVKVVLEEPEFITPGQSAVFYSDQLVIGGGFILSVTR